MKKLTIKKIVEFRGKSDRSRKTFALNLKLNKEKEQTEVGGDYWISCLSAISNSYKLDDAQPISDKIYELEDKYEIAEDNRPKTMYKRNRDILQRFEEFDLDRLRPIGKINILKQHKWNQILMLKGLSIQVNPTYVFTFQNGDVKEIGAIWFIAQLNGFRKNELGMFADITYRYLKEHYAEYTINPKYCIAVDVFNCHDVNYLQLEEKEIPQILMATIDDINKLV